MPDENTFHQRVLKDGVPTEVGIRAIRLLRHYFYCQYCAFDKVPNKNKACQNCAEANPALLTSLDAWRPLWGRMSEAQKDTYTYNLSEVIGSFIHMRYWEPKPHHHLEAALRTLEVECPECEGTGNVRNFGRTQPCTCTNGKITLYDKWEEEVS